MIELAKGVLEFINHASPIGVIALLVFVIYLLISERGPVGVIASNHLHGLPDMAASLERIEASLTEIRDTLNYLKGRLNGRAS